jgi:NDP-sugar pyrophosphorylase family protein
MIFDDFFTVGDAWEFAEYFLDEKNPVSWLSRIGLAILGKISQSTDRRQDIPPGCHVGPSVFIHESVALPPICVIEGPAHIGEGVRIRPFAYIRQNVIVGKNCLMGNSCEIKNAILLEGVQVPHFNYVGDSILGNFSHLGAGAILANLRLDKGPIVLRNGDERIATSLTKFGAIVGDHSEIACNVVLNPGTVLPRHSTVFNRSR